jgi:hypothetical protein
LPESAQVVGHWHGWPILEVGHGRGGHPGCLCQLLRPGRRPRLSRANPRLTPPGPGRAGAYAPQQRLAIAACFTEPLRIEQTRKDREARDQATAGRNAAPLTAQITQAQESAAMARVMEEYLMQLGRGA